MVERLAVNTPVQRLPDWLGKRPPAEGQWKLTFQDEFDGAQVDTNKWSFYGENYWDKVSHFTKEMTLSATAWPTCASSSGAATTTTTRSGRRATTPPASWKATANSPSATDTSRPG